MDIANQANRIHAINIGKMSYGGGMKPAMVISVASVRNEMEAPATSRSSRATNRSNTRTFR